MKITYFLTDFTFTGGSLTLYNFMNGLTQKGHDVYVVTKYESFKWTFDAQKEYEKKTIVLRFKEFIASLQMRALEKIFRQKNLGIILVTTKYLFKQYKKLNIESDIFIATHVFTADAVFKLGKGKKIVMHSQHFEELMSYTYNDIAQIKMYNNLPFNHIVNCSWLASMFKFNYNVEGKIITPGIDTTIFNGEIDDDKFLSSGKMKIITYCDPGRPFKGYIQQMDILQKLHEKYGDNIEIQFFGNKPSADIFPYVFLGRIPQKELAKHYRDSHIAVIFSWYESFPLPPIEAMSCGCAVVSTKYGTEDYLEDNISGKIINSFDTDESVRIISEVIDNPAILLSYAKNAKKIIPQFSWNNQLEKLNDYLINDLNEFKYLEVKKLQCGEYEEFAKLSDNI